MPELIDRQEALKKMCETCGYCDKFEKSMRETHPDFVTDKCNNYKFLAELPTIEAKPVRHGRMIDGRYPNENKCSECGQEFRDDIGFIIQDDDGTFRYPKRCPECGCYWDGGADNA